MPSPFVAGAAKTARRASPQGAGGTKTAAPGRGTAAVLGRTREGAAAVRRGRAPEIWGGDPGRRGPPPVTSGPGRRRGPVALQTAPGRRGRRRRSPAPGEEADTGSSGPVRPLVLLRRPQGGGGRRKVPTAREEDGRRQVWALRPGKGCGGPREEDGAAAGPTGPGRRRGPSYAMWKPGLPKKGRRHEGGGAVPPLCHAPQGGGGGRCRNLTCRRPLPARCA